MGEEMEEFGEWPSWPRRDSELTIQKGDVNAGKYSDGCWSDQQGRRGRSICGRKAEMLLLLMELVEASALADSAWGERE
jgi:hypothetical protein